ncbi:type VI secretion system tip protein TssI/VgrG [Mesorhizobium sp. LHD-90]|uniref:type VI secretion system Vgr family protein n=1 Tax=Mesorhizobium sp. LHD-90 TaxID=3071414 RepID=UPI0027DFF2C9|nr:type VI secretion system tip protein TssI/VgrG [Mesorhizobium sp. LHD-90]MDQ6434719.1 type VI secretion system tip protein TssI/VgrG [Mesorhizobium sp. LHD-90]
MASPYTQDQRVGRLDTPLGADRLALISFEGSEGLSRLFEYKIVAVNSEKNILGFDDAIGKHCTLTLNTADGDKRVFDGILAETRWTETRVEGNIYELILRPWLWVLSKRVNSLIFHEMTAPQIIEKVFGEHGGLADFQPSLSRGYAKREYCAQYRESDMDFVCRLMEEEGISYHFRHSDGAHKLILGDSASSYLPVPRASRPFISIDAQHRGNVEHLSVWRPERKFTTGKVALNDYDFKKPSANMKAEKTGDAKYENGKLESYVYPGRYVEQSDGNDYAQVQLDRSRAEDSHFHAEGDCPSLYPGALVNLVDHPAGDQNEQYLVLDATHNFEGESYRSGTGSAQGYLGSYELMRSDKPFAPPAVTQKPFIRGPQTAKVVGDGEIDCDEYGRILLRFHWDRKADKSRRVRVAQVFAGQNFGAVFTPRVGHEVLVEFLEGDPDQPIVVGSVYNADNMPPFDLPGKKNISGWKSNSTTGGGGYNEFVMDDTKGSELVRFHGQKDLDSTIENDEKRLIKNDRETTVNNNETLDVKNEISITARTKITITCGKSVITMDPMSIKIESPNVEINTSLQFKTNSKLLSQHEATAMMIINGTLVKIN